MNACDSVGRPTLAMLVPSEGSNMESERHVSAHRAEDVRSALPAFAAFAGALPTVVPFVRRVRPRCALHRRFGK
ncbi:hypothetical protein GCM10010140_68840 [Streptosporangium pseudovulgare]|uniref:Uncharacterized protein n=1 Tax=Streptosporangium pseudovulgare TaxID=35765 RepID=A0ABQ2RHU4_9ACTN|nr:hypothetical protein GCM10010140_68840 [Streptosporangium pseudovulgare]